MHLRYLSLGAGVQSTTLALMCHEGEIEPPEIAIFADTGWEPSIVYKHLEWLESILSFPVIRVTGGNLRKEVVSMGEGRANFLRIPAFTRNEDGTGGILRRQCTREYKITPINREVRRRLGAEKGKRIPKGNRATVLIGISADEAQRAKPAQEPWFDKEYPLLDRRMQRGHCLKWLSDHGYPPAPRSACVGCPFHSDVEWRNLQRNEPEAFADAVVVDRMIRDSTKMGIERPAFLHSSLKPLSDIDFSSAEDRGQLALFGHWGNECEGMCGV